MQERELRQERELCSDRINFQIKEIKSVLDATVIKKAKEGHILDSYNPYRIPPDIELAQLHGVSHDNL